MKPHQIYPYYLYLNQEGGGIEGSDLEAMKYTL